MADSELQVLFRTEVLQDDPVHVRRLADATGFFRPDEVDVAVELVGERIAKGDASGYHFVFAEWNGRTQGYVCYGPIACTVGSFDVYWIVVGPEAQRQGLGRRLLQQAEFRILALGGRLVCVETSGRPQYEPTREFYARCGYQTAAVLADFYDQDDDKLILLKRLEDLARQ